MGGCMKFFKIILSGLFALGSMQIHADKEKVLYIYNWSDYIAEDTIAKFEAQTGIKVTYDVFDSNEVLETKLLAGKTGYDIVVPSGAFLERQVIAGVFAALDRSKLPNWKNLDETLMEKVAAHDPGNQHAIPYLWGTTGIGYNVAKMREILGDDFDMNDWSHVLEPENLQKFAQCGVYFLDAPSEIIETTLNYLGKNPHSTKRSDYRLVEKHLIALRPYISKFHSSEYINALANGDICIAIGWSGDIIQAADRAAEVDNGVEIGYAIPKQGAVLWFDLLAIPKDADHKDNAHQFLNFLMEPQIIADITNYVAYPNANKASTQFVDPEILEDETIYLPQSTIDNLFADKLVPQKVDRWRTRLWNKVKTGI